MKKFPMFRGTGVGFLSEAAKGWKLWQSLPDRMDQFRKEIPLLGMQHLYAALMQKIATGKGKASYANSLHIGRMGPRTSCHQVVAVFSRAPKKRSKTVEPQTSAIYVRVKRKRLISKAADILVLEKFSPWTATTLPFVPKPTEASLVVRKVSKRELLHVQKLREDDKKTWLPALQKAGCTRIGSKIKLPDADVPVSLDTTFEALRLEFGSASGKSKPHWRPGIKGMFRYLKHLWAKPNQVTRKLFRPNFDDWKRWPAPVSSRLTVKDVQSLAWFQKRLRVRV